MDWCEILLFVLHIIIKHTPISEDVAITGSLKINHEFLINNICKVLLSSCKSRSTGFICRRRIKNNILMWNSEMNNLRLKVVDAEFFDNKNLNLLILSKQNLREIKPHAFDKLKYVEFIDLQMNSLTSLPKDLFSKTTKLKALDLSQNNFLPFSLPHDLLRNNVLLVNFTMIHNKQAITTLPELFFANMTRLKNLKLTDIGLFDLPENLLWGSSGIQELHIDKNKLAQIPPKSFRDCKNLKKLVLQHNEIRSLPYDIFSTLTSLEILDLSYNQMYSINKNLLNGLSSLRVLKIGYNLLMNVDPEAFRILQNLQVAHFLLNNWTLKPVKITCVDGIFKKSEITSADRNELLSPFHFCNGTVEKLYVDNNMITEVDVSHNEIHSVDVQGVGRPENLCRVTTNLQDNPMRCDCKLNSLLNSWKGMSSI